MPLPLPNDNLRAVNAYAVSGNSGLTVIDPGWSTPESEDALIRALGSIGFHLDDVAQFLVTHAHRDHYTQAVAIRRRLGTRVRIGIGERASLERVSSHRGVNDSPSYVSLMQRAGATAILNASLDRGDGMEPSAYEWDLPSDWLPGGMQLDLGSRTVAVVPTPGHTAGHIVFHDQVGRVLFSGDHILPHITPSIGLEPVLSRFPLRDYIDSLRLVLTIPDARLLPAHGWVTPSVHERVAELLHHHEVRLAVMGKIAESGATANDVATRVTWTRHELALSDLGLTHQRLAVSETLAHLDVLVLRGLLDVRCDQTGADRYHAPEGRRDG
jgi:glyoxylase-like metal-dependent hydrolase (beta-lactamase superfamily II)